MKRNTVFLFALVCLFCVSGFGTVFAQDKDIEDAISSGFLEEVIVSPPKSEPIVIDETMEYTEIEGGKMYASISEYFDIAVFPVVINYAPDGFQQINYSFWVHNKTEETLRDFEAVLRLHDDMEDYIDSGMTFFVPTRLDLFSKEKAVKPGEVWGIIADYASALYSPDMLSKVFRINPSGLAPMAGILRLQIDWAGGSEYFEFSVEVADETNEYLISSPQ